MTARQHASDFMLFDVLGADRPDLAASVPPHQRVLNPAERRAAETTRVAREATEAEGDRRRADVARLKAARLANEQAVALEKAAEAPKPKKGKAKAVKATS